MCRPKEKKNVYNNSEVFTLKTMKNKLWKSIIYLIALSNYKSINNQLRSNLKKNLRDNYSTLPFQTHSFLAACELKMLSLNY